MQGVLDSMVVYCRPQHRTPRRQIASNGVSMAVTCPHRTSPGSRAGLNELMILGPSRCAAYCCTASAGHRQVLDWCAAQ
jgi:hypothetical protein